MATATVDALSATLEKPEAYLAMSEANMTPNNGSQLQAPNTAPATPMSLLPPSETHSTGLTTPDAGYLRERPSTKLQRMIKGDQLIVAPGVYDGFSARIALDVGFDALYMVGCTQ